MPPSLILPGLWQGSAFDTDDEVFMRTVTHSVSATNVPCSRPGVMCMHLGVKDSDDAPILRHFERTIHFIHRARAAGGIVYVHCSQGVSRSSALTAAYIMAATGATTAEALTFVICKRPSACPNIGFYRQLKTFETSASAALPPSRRQPEDLSDLVRTLALPDAAEVSVVAFEEALRGDVDNPSLASLRWEDGVVTRRPLHLDESLPEGGIRRHLVAKGATLRVVSVGSLDGMWMGELQEGGVRGAFPRCDVRELDCASSEDEDSYQGSLGMLMHTHDDREDRAASAPVSVGLQAWVLASRERLLGDLPLPLAPRGGAPPIMALEEQFKCTEAAVVALETAAKATPSEHEDPGAEGQQLVLALIHRLQDGDDSIGMRGSALALAQSRAHGTEHPALFAAVADAQAAYDLAFDMFPKVEALFSRCGGGVPGPER